MQPVVLIVVKIPKNLAITIQPLVDVLCCTDEMSESVVDIVSDVVIPWVFGIDELLKKKPNKRPVLTYCRKYCNAEKKASYTRHVKCIPVYKIN